MTDPIAEGVKLVPQLKRGLVNDPVHGKGLRGSAMNYDVVETIIAALTAAGEMARELAEAREALKPFSEMAGELFARNWNNSDIVTVLDNPDDPHRITAGDYFNARRAYANKGELT